MVEPCLVGAPGRWTPQVCGFKMSQKVSLYIIYVTVPLKCGLPMHHKLHCGQHLVHC